ncbi:MAG: aspartyl protease [Planctomycetota bacterium]|nr:aspartyl protease [Planctomycetota bacterium]
MRTCAEKPARTKANGADMGHALVTIKVENVADWMTAGAKQARGKARIRTIIIPDALVDTGTTYLCLPSRYIKQLGLKPFPRTISATTVAGVVERRLYGGAVLTIEGRSDVFAVAELPDEAPALVGVIPLEGLDFIVDPTTQTLMGKHGAKRMMLMC